MTSSANIVAKCAAIPPFPQVATQVLTVLKDPNAPMDRIIGLVERDIALTAAVLKVANCGLYGRSGKVASVPSAVQLLGMQLFSQIVMRTSVKSYLGKSMPQAQLNRCWAHSMATAEISKILALRVDSPPDAAYSAGLLHDLGRFGLALAMPALYAKLCRPEGYVDDPDAEILHFGVSHTEVGRVLAEKFELPADIRIVVGRHHDRLDPDEGGTLAIVNSACSMASVLGFSVLVPDPALTWDRVIANTPAAVRGWIDPNLEFWQTALLEAFAE